MNIRYSRLSTGDVTNFEYLIWAKSRLPVHFLKQQILLVALVCASSLLFLFARLFTSDVDYELIRSISTGFNYGVIVDCGSSGSRAHIFKWGRDPMSSRIEFVRDQSNGKPINKHIQPGLSSLRDEPEKASDYMEPIMHFIRETIPPEEHSNTPIYFMATAGLRLLDEITQKKILTDITKDLRGKFGFPRIKSQVISGATEGAYSWLSVNMKKKFYNNSLNSRSYGIIEMGGASTQVTFELDPEVESIILKDLNDTNAISAFKNEQVILNLGPKKSVKLFASTFLGLGVNSARQAAIDTLIRDYRIGTGNDEVIKTDDYQLRLSDPCLTMGSSEIVLRPINLLKNKDQPIGAIPKKHEETFKVHLEGTGNFLNCLNLLERVLQTVKVESLNCSPKQACSMSLLGTNFIPFVHYPFIGLSEMFFTTNEMIKASGLFDRPKILHETQKICGSQYNKLQDLYSNNGSVSFEDRILYECFKASWMLSILNISGFKMPVTYENFRTINQLDGEEIDWTMGAIFAEVALTNKATSK